MEEPVYQMPLKIRKLRFRGFSEITAFESEPKIINLQQHIIYIHACINVHSGITVDP